MTRSFHMLVPSAWSTPGTVTLQGFFFFTWIWSESRAVWSRCGWLCPWLAVGAGRRRGSPQRTSTGACSSWSWPAGTWRYAPAPGPEDQAKQTLFTSYTQTPADVGVFIRLRLWLDTDLIVVLHHHQCQTTLFKLQPGDFGPELHTETDVIKNSFCP